MCVRRDGEGPAPFLRLFLADDSLFPPLYQAARSEHPSTYDQHPQQPARHHKHPTHMTPHISRTHRTVVEDMAGAPPGLAPGTPVKAGPAAPMLRPCSMLRPSSAQPLVPYACTQICAHLHCRLPLKPLACTTPINNDRDERRRGGERGAGPSCPSSAEGWQPSASQAACDASWRGAPAELHWPRRAGPEPGRRAAASEACICRRCIARPRAAPRACPVAGRKRWLAPHSCRRRDVRPGTCCHCCRCQAAPASQLSRSCGSRALAGSAGPCCSSSSTARRPRTASPVPEMIGECRGNFTS